MCARCAPCGTHHPAQQLLPREQSCQRLEAASGIQPWMTPTGFDLGSGSERRPSKQLHNTCSIVS